MKRVFQIKMISRGPILIEGRLFLSASSRKKAREKFKKTFPTYKIIFFKEYKGEILSPQ